MSKIEEARKAMERYFIAFNAQDQEAILSYFHFPFSWIMNTKARPIAKAEDYESPDKTLIETESWHYSAFDYIEPVQELKNKVHFCLAYSRFRAHGTKYSTHEALWILTKINGIGIFHIFSCIFKNKPVVDRDLKKPLSSKQIKVLCGGLQNAGRFYGLATKNRTAPFFSEL